MMNTTLFKFQLIVVISFTAFTHIFGQTTLEFIFSEQGYSNAQKVNGGRLDENISFEATTGTTPAAYYDTGAGLRVYNGGSFIILPENNVTVNHVTFTFSTNAYTFNPGDDNPASWEGNSTSAITFPVSQTCRLQKISVSYSSSTTPVITVNTDTINFSDLHAGEISANKTIIFNGNNLNAENLSITLEGRDTGHFRLKTNKSEYEINEGNIKDSISIIYQPTTPGNHTSHIKFTCSDMEKTVHLTGTATLQAPVSEEAEEITQYSFLARWNEVAGADSYRLYVFTKNILFTEDFNFLNGSGGNDGKWNGSIAGSRINQSIELSKWTFSANNNPPSIAAYKGDQCLKLGTGSIQGSATTPVLDLHGNATLYFRAGAWDNSTEQTELLLETEEAGIINPQSVIMEKEFLIPILLK